MYQRPKCKSLNCKNIRRKSMWTWVFLFVCFLGFFGHATWLGGSWLPDQGWNPHPGQWKHGGGLEFGKAFLAMTPKVQGTKRKQVNWTTSRLNLFVLQRTPSRRWKDNPQNGGKYLQIIYLIRELYRIYKEL